MSEYTAITKDAIVEGTEIEFDLYLRNGSGGNYKYVLFSRGDEQFSPERREEILNRNVHALYISTEDTDKYLKYQEKNLNEIINNENKSDLEKSGAVYQVAGNIVQDLLDDPKTGENMKRASEWVNSTVKHIIQNENAFSGLFEVASHDYNTYTHSVNTSVIGLLFGKYLSLTQHELDCLGIGLLLHDIGKLSIPPKVINKVGSISGDELKVIKKHPKAGLELLEHRNYIHATSLKIVIQHHENQDGTGYPYGIEGSDIHLFGSIARIIDVYDAMTSNRSYAKAKRPFAVLAEMKEKMSNCFNEELLKEFISFLGPKDPRMEIRAEDKLYSTAYATN
ncbi:MAG: HD domain-containing protein [Candidatus Brocadiales bacterium]|nr:HD domain-containing protein [Candidatus Brocadiales bacterium]